MLDFYLYQVVPITNCIDNCFDFINVVLCKISALAEIYGRNKYKDGKLVY